MDTRILLVYYSHTGRTAKIARLIARMADCDTERIEVVVPYKTNSEGIRKRLASEPRPAIRALDHDIRNYGTIILGMPVWDNNIPAPMATFIDKTDWRGIKVLPFFTCGGIFINVLSILRNKCKGAAITTPLYLIFNSRGDLSDVRE